MKLKARLMPNGEVWCGIPRCRGKFGYVIMDAGPKNQMMVLDLGFHKSGDTWGMSPRAMVTGEDRRGRITTFGGPRVGYARYSPPERPALLRCPRCDWVSEYNGEGESQEVAAAPSEPPPSATNGRSFSISASEWWKDPQGAARRLSGFLRSIFPTRD